MFHKLGRISAANAWWVCLGWLVLGIAVSVFAPHWDAHSQDDDISFVPERFTSVRAYRLMEKAFPKEVSDSRLIFAIERENELLTDADYALVDRIVAGLEEVVAGDEELKNCHVSSFRDGILGHRLISGDRHCVLIQVSLQSPFLAIATMTSVNKLEAAARKVFDQGGDDLPSFYTTGGAGIGRDLTSICGNSLESTTWATVLLVVVVLLIVYRAPLLALVPLLTIVVSVWVALKVLAFMTLIPGVHIVSTSKLFAIVILYGAGTDYCLFLISRYREELTAGHEGVEALAQSVGGVGEALAASAGTVMVGLGLMALAEFAKVRFAGPAIALSLGVALVASLTLTPALLKILGKKVFWPTVPPGPQVKLAGSTSRTPTLQPIHEGGFWDRISGVVAKYPLATWCISVAVIMPLVWLGIHVKPTYRATGELSPSTQSLMGIAAIQRHFTAGEVGPVTVLLAGPTDWNTREGRLEIDQLSRGFARLDNVAEVRSLTQPLGGRLPDPMPLEETDRFIFRLFNMVQPFLHNLVEEVREQSRAFYMAPIEVDDKETGTKSTHYVARLDIVLKSDPFDPASAETLKMIQAWLRAERPLVSLVSSEVQTECFGITSNAQDLAQLTESDRQRVNVFVLAAIFGILLLLVRRLWLAVYLLITVLASYYAALGATLLGGYLWTGAILPTVDWRVPFFLFTILVAVGEDYNILLVNRALQEQRRYGAILGMRRALAKTGGAITSCGLIMAGTFATLMLSGLGTLLQIGFALAFGVLVDTFIVRPFLVPAFAILCWKAGAPASVPMAVEEPEELVGPVLADIQQAA